MSSTAKPQVRVRAAAGSGRGGEGARPVLIHGPTAPLRVLGLPLEREGVRNIAVHALPEIAVRDVAAVVLVDEALARAAPDAHGALDALPQSVVAVTTDSAAQALVGSHERVLLAIPPDAPVETSVQLLRAAFRHSAARLAAARLEAETVRSRAELRELNRIGMALMTERDPDLLLVRILEQAMRLTDSDAGSLYLVETDEASRPRLRFKLSRNETLTELPFQEFTLPLDESSLAGYAAVTGEALRFEDAYAIPEGAPYRLNRSFDERFGYRTKSMLVVPMSDHRGEVVGVLQLLNRKADPAARITSDDDAARFVLPYEDHELELVGSLAGQAAVSIENTRLYKEIESIFESFVKAAVTAIDQRDPTTAGHSIRVATLTLDIAEAVPRLDHGPFKGVRFTREQMRELRYAALLHDFGKVGVREEVLVKAKKLPVHLWERVEARFDLVRAQMEAEYQRRRADALLAHGGQRSAADVDAALRAEFERELAELDRIHDAVRRANEPSVLPEDTAEILTDVAARTFRHPQGRELPFLAPDELHYLSIRKGSLDEKERREIESHVEQTYRFLTQIPWTDDLTGVPEIAYGHHEKLNGRGYPRGVTAEQIPLQARIMTVADIFDALTASDRPYKKALSAERALSILEAEAKEGLVEPTLVELLIDAQLYRRILEEDWREL